VQKGRDISNGNLLGTKQIGALSRGVRPPRRVPIRAAVAEVRASTYCSVAVTQSGRVLSWGDSDGGALGHAGHRVHTPALLPALALLRVRHVSSSYTNGAAVTEEGRVFVWGGQHWEGGIAARDADAGKPTEVQWGGVPSCYRCDAVSLAHRHGYLVFKKKGNARAGGGAGAGAGGGAC
jgi:alpha-tubulin suppressor-like RCC1 family protein